MSERISYQPNTTPFIPEGRIEVRSTGIAINTSASREEAAQQAAQLRSRGFLQEFFNPYTDQQRVLDVIEHSDGRIALIEPTAKYAHLAFMVIAASNGILRGDPNELVQTEKAYDFTPSLHEEYLRTAIAGLLAAEKLAPKGNITFIAENSTEVTDANNRMSRTIPFAHAHIVSVDPSTVTPTDQKIDHLTREQRLLRKSMPRIIKNVLENPEYLQAMHNVTKANDQHVSFGERMIPPVGYALTFNTITRENIMEQLPAVVEILRLNHAIYEKVEQDERASIKNQRTREAFKPELSKREYFFFDPVTGVFTAFKSSEIISHAGVMEAAGGQLTRSASAPEVYDRRTYDLFNDQFVNGVRQHGQMPEMVEFQNNLAKKELERERNQ